MKSSDHADRADDVSEAEVVRTARDRLSHSLYTSWAGSRARIIAGC